MNIIKELYHHFLLSDGVSTDSRENVNNKMFFALSGDNFNGNRFASDAIEKGARLCVIDDPNYNTDEKYIFVNNVLTSLQELAKYHRKKTKVTVLAITGSNGKTTTKELVTSVLGSYNNIISTKGNLNNHIGVPLTLLNIEPATKIAVVEIGANHIGEISKLCEIALPDIGIITNIGKAHLEGFGSFEGVITAKNELYEYLYENKKTAILNNDDELLVKLSNRIQKFTYGKNNANVEGQIITHKPHLKINWSTGKNIFECSSNLYGKYNFENIMAAIACGLFFKVPTENINKAIVDFVPNNNRSQQIKTKNNYLILDAYNANPFSMNRAVVSFAEYDFDNPWLILGDMFELGEYSSSEHQNIVNEIINKEFRNVVLIGDEFYNTVGHNFLKFKTTNEAIAYFSTNIIKNADILVKGSRGMKLEKLIIFL